MMMTLGYIYNVDTQKCVLYVFCNTQIQIAFPLARTAQILMKGPERRVKIRIRCEQ